jgi:hypothetical protein
MFVQSHLLLADTIARRMSAELPEKFALGPFFLGAVYPDFTPVYKKIDHNLAGALPVVQELIQSVRAAGNSREINERQAFHMGIICHFICDFFCQAHNFREYQSTLNHVLYEIQMDIFIHHALREPEPFMSGFLIEFTTRSQGGMESIEEAHRQYLGATRSLMTDLSFAAACSTVVMKNCISPDISVQAAA